MKPIVSHVKVFSKSKDGTWSWSAPIWLGKGIFANCVITSPEGRTFPSMNKAHKDMVAVLKTMGIIHKRKS